MSTIDPKSAVKPEDLTSGISVGDSLTDPEGGDDLEDQLVPSGGVRTPLAVSAVGQFAASCSVQGPFVSRVAPKEDTGREDLSDDVLTNKVAERLEDRVAARVAAKIEDKMLARLDSIVAARTTDLNEKVIILENKVARMEFRETEAAKREAQCKEEINKLSTRISKLEKEKNALEEKMESLKKEKEEEIERLKEERNGKEEENQCLKRQAEEYERIIAELKEELESVKEELKRKIMVSLQVSHWNLRTSRIFEGWEVWNQPEVLVLLIP